MLEQEGQGRQKKVKYNSLVPGEDDPVSESGILVHEKRTRFSLSHDQDSIGSFIVIILRCCCLSAQYMIITLSVSSHIYCVYF